MQWSVHLEAGEPHNNGVDEVSTEGESTEWEEAGEGEQSVEGSSVASAAGNHNPCQTQSPGGVAEGSIGGTGVQTGAFTHEAVHQAEETTQGKGPAHKHPSLKNTKTTQILISVGGFII